MYARIRVIGGAACGGNELTCRGTGMPDYQSAIRTMAAGESVLIVIEGRGGYHLAIGHPPATEVECGDERDNDFDGNADSFDSDCPLAP